MYISSKKVSFKSD